MCRVEERGWVKVVDVDGWKSDEMGEGVDVDGGRMHVDRWKGACVWVEEWMWMGGC